MPDPIRRLIGFYALNIRLLQTWRLTPAKIVRRLLLSTAIAFVAFGVAVALVRGITVTNLGSILGAVIVIGLLNVFLRPVALAVAVPFGILAVGILGTVLQVVLVLAVGSIVPGLRVVDATAAVEGALIFALTNTALAWFVALGEDESYFSHLMRLLIRESAHVTPTDEPGVVIVQIDGLAHPVLVNQIRAGRVPTMSRWIRTGTHRLTPWETQLPSQTSASQAGILFGHNDGIPAFRWFEKSSGRLFVSNRPPDAAEIEKRLTDGKGLLAPDGSSLGNLVSGDAKESLFTMSRLSDRRAALGPTRDWFYFFASPFQFARAVFLSIGEIGKELWQARRQAAKGIEPRIDRGGAYPILRAVTNVFLREVLVALLVERILRGVPVIYVDFNDYDEIAHHAGPERGESLDALDGVDAVIGALEKVAVEAPRPYRFVVLSDHGQSQGATFRQRYGLTVEQLVNDLAGGAGTVTAATSIAEPWGALNALVGEATRGAGLSARLTKRAMRSRSTDGHIDLGPGRGEMVGTDAERHPDRPEIVVCGSGNLGLVYFITSAQRLTLEDLDALHPGLVGALAHHDGIGFVLVRSREDGALVIGPKGRRYLDRTAKDADRHTKGPDAVEGDDPLAPFGRHAVDDLRRLDAMPNVGDLVLNSRIDPDTQEVAAFEELVGSHGGIGGWQTKAFVLHPSDWSMPADGRVVGAPAIYRQMVAWLEAVGIRRAQPRRGGRPASRAIR